MIPLEPSYLPLLRTGVLAERARVARDRLAACDICPRRCGANRLSADRWGHCRTGERAVVASYHPHLGEEAPLVGRFGSGTIFFSRCNLHCCFCQNCELSQFGEGAEVGPEELAEMMLQLQARGCHNVNLVSPTHVVPQILAALLLAADSGLRLPLVYNTGGYDALDTLRLLDGVVDIYMPDMKYADDAVGLRLSGVSDYAQVNRSAVKEMHRQVGDLALDARGLAQRGLLVRHLVLPGGLAGTPEVVRFLSREISADTYLNIMDQYRPCFQASEMPPLDRRLTGHEYESALHSAREAGLWRLDRV